MPSWVDYAELGLLSAQLGTTNALRAELGALRASVAQAQLKEHTLAVKRDLVFRAGRAGQALSAGADKAPQQTYVRTAILAGGLVASAAGPEGFSEFADKQYAQQVLDQLDECQARARALMDARQVSVADACIRAVQEMPLLDAAVEYRKLEAEIGAVEAELQARGLADWVIPGALLVILAPICLVASSPWFLRRVVHASPLMGDAYVRAAHLIPPVSTLALLLTVALITVLVLRLVRSRDFRLSSRRQSLVTQLPQPAQRRAFESVWGGCSLADLESIKRDRVTLLERVLG